MKLLNRMLWMHGQGLWNAFQNMNASLVLFDIFSNGVVYFTNMLI